MSTDKDTIMRREQEISMRLGLLNSAYALEQNGFEHKGYARSFLKWFETQGIHVAIAPGGRYEQFAADARTRTSHTKDKSQ